MKVGELVPQPDQCETFKHSRIRFVPEKSGSYVLATFSREILYIGLSVNLRKRMKKHLDNPSKTGITKTGRAVLFFWIESDEIHKIERTWLNMHVQCEGRWPELNKVYSPVST